MKHGQTDRMKEERYHHGNLAEALIDAGQAELEEKGIEGFSLRGVAKRAGVSHAAPAHHFGDSRGLLTAIAARGFDRFLETQKRYQAGAPTDPRSQLAAAGVGYVRFALENPSLFRLMFSSDRPDFVNEGLDRSSTEGFDHLVNGVCAVMGLEPGRHPEVMMPVAATWSIAHGIADLLVSGRLKMLEGLEGEALDQAVLALVSTVLPPAGASA